MPNRRILSLWFPRLGAERLLRMERGTVDAPFAVVRDTGQMQVLSSLSAAASAEGLFAGQPLRDARAMCPELLTRLQNAQAEAAFLTVLRRWAGKFSPWVGEEAPSGLVIDLTGCAHLFGGEEALLAQVEADCADLGLSVQAGIADTVGAAWALARYAGQGAEGLRSGDAVDQEARATRSRAAKRRHWERGGQPPAGAQPPSEAARIARPGHTRSALADLPIAALRLSEAARSQLNRLGIRRVGDLAGTPRAALARRFGQDVVRRLDQALGVEPEPVSPAKPPLHFAVRLTLPDPIGLEADVMAAVDRLLPPLCTRLREKGRGARRIRLQAYRTDQTMQALDLGLARPSHDPDRLRPLLSLKIGELEAGFGFDMLRLEAHVTEPLHARQHRGHIEAAGAVRAQLSGDTGLDDLIGRLGARIGLETITRLHPASSHIPEKTASVLAAAWSEPAADWPAPTAPRPLRLWPPEPVMAPEAPNPPAEFRWRGQTHITRIATGPERIAPEWWLDDPHWRSGLRDYWRLTTEAGETLWLYFAHGALMSAGWFCQGRFA
ncbi:DNA polymerase Y family protein [Pseudoruegeria sp. SHC-113]|uniref:DNA polymerase Y family protein n=1 Tax=Pseudoruegeria sp. SHC-113 TaxID=2855439 RepID=UPI0021BA6C69|nr:DNA polymerase Y family protein [Pseudoruegeria sp. SHC-113]MCT8159043.1 DNA polymerase Y family protein [Pseudoruegeria sp. SHC-113]